MLEVREGQPERQRTRAAVLAEEKERQDFLTGFKLGQSRG